MSDRELTIALADAKRARRELRRLARERKGHDDSALLIALLPVALMTTLALLIL